MLGKAQWQNLSGRHLQTSCSACESTRVALISGSGCSAPRVSHPPPGTQGRLWHIIPLQWLKANGLLRRRLLRHRLWTGNSVQFSGCCVWLFLTPWTATCQASLSITNSWGLTQTYVHWGGDAIQPSHPLSSPAPAFNISQHQGLFQWIRWPKYWSFSFSISPSNEYSGLNFFRMDSLDLLIVQGTLKSLLQCHSSKASILCTQLSFQSNSHIHTWLLEKP